MTTLRFGFSPCPNDTVQFYALVHNRIDTLGLKFEPVLLDVEALNQKALCAELELTKASYAILGRVADSYWCLRSGGALGRGCGPLWVTKGERGAEELANLPIAHPGLNTTAHLLLTLRLGKPPLGEAMVFSEVMGRVAAGDLASGVIIHEGRFTYRERGLHAVEDLGQWWEGETSLPIPLGCILLKRGLSGVDPADVEGLLRKSHDWALENPSETARYIAGNAQEMEPEVIKSHIALYVNEFSRDLGAEGERAVLELIERQIGLGLAKRPTKDIFPPRRLSDEVFGSPKEK